MKLKPLHIALIALAAILIAAFFWAITSFRAPTVQAPSAPHDALLEQTALGFAHAFGLQGDPTATRYERMTLGEWNALIGAGTADEEADVPVFVFVLRGDVSLSTSPDEATDEPDEPVIRDNMVLILDARDGALLGVMSKPNADDLPVALP